MVARERRRLGPSVGVVMGSESDRTTREDTAPTGRIETHAVALSLPGLRRGG